MPHEYHTKRRIEFSDTDMAGIVHFARFFVFMESAEHEFLRSLRNGKETRSVGPDWQPRVSISSEDELEIHLTIARKGTKSLTYQFVFMKDNVKVAHGQLTSACCIATPAKN